MAAVGTLTIEMAANVYRLQQDMERATKSVRGAMDKIQRSVQGATRALGVLTAAFAAYKTVQGILQQADAMTQLNSRLQLVTRTQEEFVKTQTALISISQRSYTSLGATVDLYTALARSTREVGVSQNELLRVVETFNKSIIISGGSVQAAEAAITQFNQAMASGVLRGEEFNSISEQAPMIMELLANSLGVTRGALRDMAKEGLLVAELVLPALIEGSKGVDEQFAQMNKTVGQAGQQMKNSFMLFLDELNRGQDITSTFAGAIDAVTSGLDYLTRLLKASQGDLTDYIDTQAESAKFARQQAEALKSQEEAVKSRARAMLEQKERDELAKKAADELQKSYDKLLETLRADIRGSTAALQTEQQGLNQAQEDFLKLVSGPQWKQYTEAQRMLVTDLFKQRIETEKLIDAEKARAKAAEERLKKMLDDEKEFREELAKEDKKNEEDRIKAQEKLYEEHRRQIEKIGDDLTDALMRAFESGKGFGQAFKDTLVNMFRTMVLRPILAPISGAIAGAFGAGGAAAAGGAIPGMGGGGAGMGFLAGMGAAASSLGVGMAAGFTNALTGTFAGSLTAAGQLIGTGSMAGISAGLGMAAGTLLPVVGVIMALPSIKKALFGGSTQVVGGGLTGTIGGGEANVRSFVDKYKSGGLFRSSKSWQEFSTIAPELDRFLNDSALAIINQTSMFAEMLNVNADRIGETTLTFTRQFKGLSAEQQQEEIVKVLELYGELLARRLLGSLEEGTTDWLKDWVPGEFVKEGESASEALNRLATSLATVNQVFDTLNYAMFNASLRSAEMASKIIEAFGNAEAFVERTTFFYAEFYTEAERTATTTRQLATIMGELDLELPKTREQFRLLVESQDITTQSGRDMYAMLLNLAPTFAQISDSVEELYQKAQDATNTALQVLERSIAAQQEALRLSERLAQQNVDAIQSVFDVLQSSIRGLTGGGFTFQTGQAFIAEALQTARGMGPLPNAEQLQSAIGAVTSGLSPSAFRSEFEFRRAQASLVSQLTELQGFTETQLSTAEETLIAITEQISRLDEQLELARTQVNELRGINTSVLTVADAIYQLEATMKSEQAALSTKQSTSLSTSSAGTQTAIQTKKQKDAQTLITDLYLSGGYTLPIDGGDQDVFQNWLDYATRRGNQRTIDVWASQGNKGTTTATFAAGGLHTGGMRIVGERGPELEMTGPARYMSNATLASMMGNGNNEELRQLREENRVQMRALVSLQNRMTKLLERWDGDGLPEERAVA